MIQGVSLNAELRTFVHQRSAIANVSISRYVQSLIEFDRARNILPDALTMNLKQAV